MARWNAAGESVRLDELLALLDIAATTSRRRTTLPPRERETEENVLSGMTCLS